MGRRCNNLTSQKFGRLEVLERAENDKDGNARWRCKCECGTEKRILGGSLLYGKSISCGCFKREKASERATTHGEAKTRLYAVWQSMKARCQNPKNPEFHRYGGREISICPEWENDFLAFRTWSKANGHRDGLTIDRINNDGNYTPQNCQFITRSENSKKAPRIVKYSDETIRKIREEYTGVHGQQIHLSLKFNVPRGHINRIIRNRQRINI